MRPDRESWIVSKKKYSRECHEELVKFGVGDVATMHDQFALVRAAKRAPFVDRPLLRVGHEAGTIVAGPLAFLAPIVAWKNVHVVLARDLSITSTLSEDLGVDEVRWRYLVPAE